MKHSMDTLTVILKITKRKVSSHSKTKGIILLSLIVTSIFIFWTDFKFYKPFSPLNVTFVKNVIAGTGNIIIIANDKHFEAKIPSQQQRKVKSGGPPLHCVIPQTPIMPDFFKDWQPNSKSAREKHDCGYVTNLAKLKDEKTLQLLQIPATNQSCCLQEILRGDTDFLYNFTDCTEISETTTLDDHMEAFAVKCGELTNVDTLIPIRPSVHKKLEHWKEITEENTPISVLFFGFDSVSRAHAYRSIPKTLEWMSGQGFVDFQGYHSIAPSTLTNFMGFLMGMTRTEVRLTCAPDWTAPFDNCPLIWKKFHEQNYITSYIEDGLQSFNWGGQSGFVEKPTDYYLHHLFLALQDLRETQVKKFHLDPRKKNLTLDCTSREKIPEFLFRYTERFLEKFAQTPFFSFTWFAYPFHEDISSLSHYDEALSSFLQLVTTAHRELLRNTMIVFLSDHGDRTSFFSSTSIESFIERGFPPLFIRLPDILAEKYPEMKEALRHNSKLLATPFDVHHTLLHILSLSSSNSKSKSKLKTKNPHNENFKPGLKDRSSLLIKVPENRTCSDTNIPPTNCLCNVQYRSSKESQLLSSKYIANNKFVHKLLRFSISQLNRKLWQTEYKEDCEKWTSNPATDIIYTKIISEAEGYFELLMAFIANPGLAKFEARLKILLKEKGETINLVGFSRINQYGTQSWCVRSTTDSDKEMKEICMCKGQEGKS